ncbi:hypothetical protein SG26_03150 [Haloarcula sp. CBA1115]|uniref:DUF6716 putative glycosyltransferase n=1 Tax=unclassified Haloarcula TaxID=2624677 RepID=UPI00059556C4|nr:MULTISPECIES: DUF6716 putative glycosyltransferase [unclassified Haloarcula]AJF24777.1 hypothetical protein SG26_03150 [Haloarcula sp. CBA1115]
MAKSRTHLYITDEYISDPAANVVSLPAVVSSIEYDRYYELKQQLETIEDDTPTRIPILDSLWKHILLEKKGSLFELALLYDPLVDRIHDADPSVVVTDISDPKYDALLADIEATQEFDIRSAGESNGEASTERRQAWAQDILSTVVLLASQFVWLLLGIVGRGNTVEQAETVVFPYSGRESSTRPVVEGLQRSFLVVVRAPIFFNNSLDKWSDTDAASLSSLVDGHTFLCEVGFLVRFGKEFLIDRQTERQLRDALQVKVGVQLTHSVRYAFVSGCRGNIHNFLFATSAAGAFSRTGCERVVVGGNSPEDRAILALARECGLSTYYVPHSIAHPKERMYLHHPETTMFLASNFDQGYLDASFDNERLPTLVPAGRPYLQETLDEEMTTTAHKKERLKIVLATQDGPDNVRERFCIAVLKGIEACPIQDQEVVIKIHPDERVAFYESLLDSLDLDVVADTMVETEGLRTHLRTADLVVTINSNVGLEGMYVGTPCVCVNLWEPLISTYPYSSEGPAPVCRTVKEVNDLFQRLTWDKIQQITEQQRRFAESYRYEYDTGERIAAHIEGRH